MLYLTVLGFDSITISFCKASGVDESLVRSLGKNPPKLKLLQVGLLMGVSSLLGFLGSVAFPLLRAKLGTPFTALIGSLTSLPPVNMTPMIHPLLRSLHPGRVRRHLCNLYLPPLIPVHDRDRGRDDQHGPGLKKGKDSGRRSSFQCSGVHVCQWIDCSQVRPSPL